MTARRYPDPAVQAESHGATQTATAVPEEDRQRARRYVASRALDAADLVLLLDALGLDQPAP
ncbi:hypothetical protein [Kitasatospora sp. A2-31]|uniref:hypothetical protein n=1 Tax=Kitasatospora sp. A2-31 TaxID=2916414 RepID=UPI001EE85D91|nr:hypothetical protein [Kitasatospora sp. A2-31]MCG6493392.1 hypothetical protein [Kitasatospora sp. A2-31]